MFDSHTHLEDELISINKVELLNEFIKVGGAGLLNVGFTIESNLQVLMQASNGLHHKDLIIKSAIGLHPTIFGPSQNYKNSITDYNRTRKALEWLEKTVTENIQLLAAIGETGLDYYRIDSDFPDIDERAECIERQKISFRRHVQIARETRLPLTIHTRDKNERSKCVEDTLEILCETGSSGGIFHSYTGAPQYLDDILGLGLYIGFNAIVTYKSADNVRELVRKTPIESIVVESDAPYLPVRSQKKTKTQKVFGQPSDIKEVIKVIAEIKSLSPSYVAQATSENFKAIFGD